MLRCVLGFGLTLGPSNLSTKLLGMCELGLWLLSLGPDLGIPNMYKTQIAKTSHLLHVNLSISCTHTEQTSGGRLRQRLLNGIEKEHLRKNGTVEIVVSHPLVQSSHILPKSILQNGRIKMHKSNHVRNPMKTSRLMLGD